MQDSFHEVERLRTKLTKEYPILTKINKDLNARCRTVKARSSDECPVRPTFSSEQMNSMIKNSSRFVKIKDYEYPPSPKTKKPIFIKTQEFEVTTSVDCFLKHISTKSYQKYIAEHVPGFRKSIIKIVQFPATTTKKHVNKTKELCLNDSNLELLGQKEIRTESGKAAKRNLLKVNKKIDRSVKDWCRIEAKKFDPLAQVIDYYTFRYKSIS